MSATTSLMRKLAVGERLSFDGGRIVLMLEEKSGRRASLRLVLREDVVVDKPRGAANDPRGNLPAGQQAARP